ncbi:MAG: hypothetical protein LC781_18310 [Actinobacteria bacterium]|nr:hypothetical protein [Actinomycetota bacterium]
MIDDAELARRSILGFGEMFAALGRGSVGPERALASQAGQGLNRAREIAQIFYRAGVPIGCSSPLVRAPDL